MHVKMCGTVYDLTALVLGALLVIGIVGVVQHTLDKEKRRPAFSVEINERRWDLSIAAYGVVAVLSAFQLAMLYFI